MPQPNTLRLQFTPAYTGLHRVCYRLGIVGPYDCSTIVMGTSGVPQTVDIPFDYSVINDTCTSDTIEGYVQPTCVPETCPYLKTLFSVGYTPYCRFWTVQCTGVPIAEVNVIAYGSGYTPGAIIPIVFTGGGGGINLDVDAYVSDNAAIAVSTSNVGTGYTDGSFTNVATIPAGPQPASGTGIQFDTLDIVGGSLNSTSYAAYSPDSGSGYLLNDTFTINIPGNAGNGDMLFIVTAISNGEVIYTKINDPGENYASAPTGTIPGAAAFDVILGECPAYDLGDDCSGGTIGLQPGHKLGWSYFKCEAIGAGNPISIDGWTATLGTLPANCCYACEEITFNNTTGSAQDIFYIDFATKAWTTVNLPDSASTVVQAVAGSGWMSDNTPFGGGPVSGVPCP